MAYKWSRRSIERKEGVHPYLQLVCSRVLLSFDITVLWRGGVRSDEDQKALYAIGRTTELDRKPVTQLDGVTRKSKHQIQEDGYAHAIDIAPYPVDFSTNLKAKARFYQLNGHMQQAWASLKEKGLVTGNLRWGGDWDQDNDFLDQSFDDLPHWEWQP